MCGAGGIERLVLFLFWSYMLYLRLSLSFFRSYQTSELQKTFGSMSSVQRSKIKGIPMFKTWFLLEEIRWSSWQMFTGLGLTVQDLHSALSICKISFLKADYTKEKGEKVIIEGNLTLIFKRRITESFRRGKMYKITRSNHHIETMVSSVLSFLTGHSILKLAPNHLVNQGDKNSAAHEKNLKICITSQENQFPAAYGLLLKQT